jgi:hypothetical protein
MFYIIAGLSDKLAPPAFYKVLLRPGFVRELFFYIVENGV